MTNDTRSAQLLSDSTSRPTSRLYKRPQKADKARHMPADARFKWIDKLHSIARNLMLPIDLLAAEEHYLHAARARPGGNRNPWINCQLRARHMAVIEVLQRAHLKNTGQEISRSEVVAALMAAGLDEVLHHKDFQA